MSGVLKSITSKRNRARASGDVVYAQLEKLFPEAVSELSSDTNHLFKSVIQNQAYASSAESFECNSGALEDELVGLFDSIQKKWSDKKTATQVFLNSITDFHETFVLTPHPNNTLTREAIDLLKKFGLLVRSQEFNEWIGKNFDPEHPVVDKLKTSLGKIAHDLGSNVPTANLTMNQEMTAGVKSTEGPYDSTEYFLNVLDKVLRKKTGSGITLEIANKYLSKKQVDVKLWDTSDQDGKADARPKYMELLLDSKGATGLNRLYILEVAKIYESVESKRKELGISEDELLRLKNDLTKITIRLMNRLDPDEKKLLRSYDTFKDAKTPKEFTEIESKTSKANISSIIQYVKEGLPKAAGEGSFAISQGHISFIQNAVEERVNGIRNNDVELNRQPYSDMVKELNHDLDNIHKKFGKHLPKHVLQTGEEAGFDSVLLLKAKVSSTGDSAAKCQLRQNGRDIENAILTVLKSIQKEGKVELSDNLKYLVVYLDEKSAQLSSIEEQKEMIRKYEIKLLKSKNGQDVSELKDNIRDAAAGIDTLEQSLSRVREKITEHLSRAVYEIDQNKELRVAFKEFVASRDKDYFNFTNPPSKLAESIVLGKNEGLKEERKQKESELDRKKEIKKLSEPVTEDIKTYDRLKSIEFMVNNPDKVPDYISAECDGANTLFSQHILARALLGSGNSVKNSIFSLAESFRTINELPQEWEKVLANNYVLEQMRGVNTSMPKVYDDKTGAERDLTSGDIYRMMGIKNVAPELASQKITNEAIAMIPRSDNGKVFSVIASDYLSADVGYKLTKLFAENGLLLKIEHGGGSGVGRGAPVKADIRTIQGKERRMSPLAYCLSNVNRKISQVCEFLGLEKQKAKKLKPEEERISKDPRFNFSNEDWLAYRYISNNPDRWEEQKRDFYKRVGQKYAELYESAAFGKYFTAGSLQEFAKLVSFSARSVIKTGDKSVDDVPYPEETSVEKMRAIQFNLATSLVNAHVGMMIHHIFEDDNGNFNLNKFNSYLSDYMQTEDGKRNPVLQRAMNISAYSLGQADLGNSWKMLGAERKRNDYSGCIEIDGNIFDILEVAGGNHDEAIKAFIKKTGIYSNIKNPTDYENKLDDEVIALRAMAFMDVHTVKSRKTQAMMLDCAAKGKTELTQEEYAAFASQRYLDSKQLVIDAMPHKHKQELMMTNGLTDPTFSELAELHEQLKKNNIQLPKKKMGEDGIIQINTKDKAFPLYERLCYLVSCLMESTEKVPAAATNVNHAKTMEYDHISGKRFKS